MYFIAIQTHLYGAFFTYCQKKIFFLKDTKPGIAQSCVIKRISTVVFSLPGEIFYLKDTSHLFSPGKNHLWYKFVLKIY